MKELNSEINYCVTAEHVNGKDLKIIFVEKRKREYRKQSILQKKIENCVKNKIASCGELAILLYSRLYDDFRISKEIKKKINIIILENNDHEFVQIGEIDDPLSIIIDPWIRYLDLKVTPGFRDKVVMSNERSVGFMGSKEQYLNFLGSHADGKYVKKLSTPQDKYIFKKIPITNDHKFKYFKNANSE